MTSALPVRARFLRNIWRRHSDGAWLFLASKRGKRWIDHPIQNDEALVANIRAFFQGFNAHKYDLYFCPNAFHTPKRKAENALGTPYAWCDIDEADPSRFVSRPGVLWESSPGRYQGLWPFNKRLRPKRAESVSKYLTYEFGGDPNGWSVTKVLRIPGTYNHKRDGRPPKVKFLKFDPTKIDPKPLLRLAPKIRTANHHVDGGTFDLDRDPKALFQKYRKRIKHTKARVMLRHRRVFVPDRSRQIFIMIKGLVEAGVPWSDIACLIWHSPYFQSKHGTDINALEAEIQRAMNKFDTGEQTHG